MTYKMKDALYTTLQVFAKSLGARQVAEICQQFILDSIPSEPTAVKKFKIVKTEPAEKPIEKPMEKPIEKPAEKPAEKPIEKTVKKITPLIHRNFKKMAQETHFLPVGTILITSETDQNPAIFATITRTPLGAPAIQPSWDKTKFFTGTLTPPVMFLKEVTKHFKIMSSKPVDTRNAWNDVYKRNTDGSNISLADLWKQTVA